MDNVGNIVSGVLERNNWQGKILERMAVELWAEVAGEHLARHTIAEKFAGGTLHVRVRSPQWTHELHFLEPRLIARLNGRLKKPIVQKIRASVTTPPGMTKGKLKSDWEDPTFPDPEKLEKIAKKEPIDDDAARKGLELTGEIEDAEMRAVMARLIASVKRAQEERDKEKLVKSGQKATR